MIPKIGQLQILEELEGQIFFWSEKLKKTPICSTKYSSIFLIKKTRNSRKTVCNVHILGEIGCFYYTYIHNSTTLHSSIFFHWNSWRILTTSRILMNIIEFSCRQNQMTVVGIPIGKAADFAYNSILRTQFDYERLRDTFILSCAMWPNEIKIYWVNLVGYGRLEVIYARSLTR